MVRTLTRHVAFLRAVNVAGHARVTMPALGAAFSAAGCANVRTYIQSGNVLFDCAAAQARLFTRIRAEVDALIGSEPEIVFRTLRQVESLVRSAPFTRYETEAGIKLYVAFLCGRPAAPPRFPLSFPKEGLEAFGMKDLDVFIISRRKPNGFYGFPNNFIEGALDVRATTRNWSTVTKIVDLAAV